MLKPSIKYLNVKIQVTISPNLTPNANQETIFLGGNCLVAHQP